MILYKLYKYNYDFYCIILFNFSYFHFENQFPYKIISFNLQSYVKKRI